MKKRFGSIYWPREVDKPGSTGRRGERRRREGTRAFPMEMRDRRAELKEWTKRPREGRRWDGERREEVRGGRQREQRETERETTTIPRRHEGGEGTLSRRTKIRVREEDRDK